MAVTPSGSLSLPLKYLRASIAASAAFQTAVGAVSAAAAEAFIYHGEVTAARPRVIIGSDFTRSRKNDTTHWIGSGKLLATFEFSTPSDYLASVEDARWWFNNLIGTVIDQMQDLAMSAGYLSMIGTIVKVIGRTDPDQARGGSYWAAEVQVEWSGQG